jgi:hypothetical protein
MLVVHLISPYLSDFIVIKYVLDGLELLCHTICSLTCADQITSR